MVVGKADIVHVVFAQGRLDTVKARARLAGHISAPNLTGMMDQRGGRPSTGFEYVRDGDKPRLCLCRNVW